MPETLGFFGVVANQSPALEIVLQRISAARKQDIHRLILRGIHAAIQGCFSGDSRGSVAWLGGGAGSAQAAREAYERMGPQSFPRLEGNSWLAVFDPALHRFRITTDLAGAKPLFYCIASPMGDAQIVLFGSSASELLHCGALAAVANVPLLHKYLSSGTLAGDSETLYQGVNALRRRHYLEVVPGPPMSVRQIGFPEPASVAASSATLEERALELRSLLSRTIAAQAGSAKVAVALSGGIDSSGILACLGSARSAGEPLSAFSYLQRAPAMPDAWDERPWAESAAAHVHAKLHSVELKADELPLALSRAVAAQDFPFGSPVVLAQAKLFRFAAEKGTDVMLSGHGPDILFGGGTSQIVLRLAELIRRGRFVAAARMLPGAAAHATVGAPRLLAASMRRALRGSRRGGDFANRLLWASTEWFSDRMVTAKREEPESPAAHLEPMQAMIQEQLDRSPGSTALMYEEGNARAQGLHNRLPYLTAEMVNFSRSCPSEYLVSREGQTKHVLRRALAGMLPEEILQRPARVGFAVPALPWLLEQREWAGEIYRELDSLPFFRGVPAAELWARLEGRTPAAWSVAYRIWRWIVLLEWARARNVRFE